MIQSDILKEKDRIQKKLSTESTSIHEYLMRSQLAAQEISETYGFRLHYIESPNKIHRQMENKSLPNSKNKDGL
jgi:hypothetical protein